MPYTDCLSINLSVGNFVKLLFVQYNKNLLVYVYMHYPCECRPGNAEKICLCKCFNWNVEYVRETKVLLRVEGYCGCVFDDCNDHKRKSIKKLYYKVVLTLEVHF